jgi:predicted nucleic acid-binding Zn ribbon protein
MEREEIREKKKAVYYYRKRHGLCVQCGEPAAPGRVRCLNCLDAVNVACMITRSRWTDDRKKKEKEKLTEQKKMRRVRYREEGRCVICGKPADPGRRMCKKHREMLNRKEKERRLGKKEDTEV